MRLLKALAFTTGWLLCWLWFEIITPRFGNGLSWEYGFDGEIVSAWLIGWFFILGAVFFVFNRIKNSR